MSDLVDVALPVPLRRTFTYRVPQDDPALPLGARIAVPFHGRKLAGFVVGHPLKAPEGVKRILRVAGRLEREPVFGPELLRFLIEAGRYYLHPVGEVLRAAAPALPKGAFSRLREKGFLDEKESIKGRAIGTKEEMFATLAAEPPWPTLGKSQAAAMDALAHGERSLSELRQQIGPRARQVVLALEGKGLVTVETREVLTDPFFGKAVVRDTPPTLHPAQARAVERMIERARQGSDAPPHAPQGFLLHGVTGSGKTEVYLHVIDEARARGKGALLLVPEIALTPQLVDRFRARFGDEIAVLHSGLKDRERDQAWRRLRRGELRLAVGARSALFAPVPELGVIVVDEEHDGSFKQEDGFRYQARDMALLRAARAGAICVLGSATPSVESYHGAVHEKRLELLRLPERATSHPLPQVEVIDLRRHRKGPTPHLLISGPLHRHLSDCLRDGDQAILFLNRRGFAPSVRCTACGHVAECPGCSVALTVHRRKGGADHEGSLRCHYCDHRARIPEQCEKCGSAELLTRGLGTQQLEEALGEVFPDARVARLDRDVASGPRIEEILGRLRRREVDVLVGTQMVAKGHDLPGVTFVGVVQADQSLAFPDFRAGERTFQLLAQVAGRAGRGERKGRVLFQSYQPEHPAIQAAAAHDYERFFEAELAERQDLEYPPISRLVAVRADGGSDEKTRQAIQTLANLARRHPAVGEGRIRVVGPAPAPIARLRSRFRHRFLIRGETKPLRAVAAKIAARIDEGFGSVRASVDIDPVSML